MIIMNAPAGENIIFKEFYPQIAITKPLYFTQNEHFINNYFPGCNYFFQAWNTIIYEAKDNNRQF